MGLKPITKYCPAFQISNKAYEILKERAYRISKEKAYFTLDFMGLEPMTSIAKYFPAYEISKEKALKIQALEFKPMPNYFTAVQNVKEEPKKN